MSLCTQRVHQHYSQSLFTLGSASQCYTHFIPILSHNFRLIYNIPAVQCAKCAEIVKHWYWVIGAAVGSGAIGGSEIAGGTMLVGCLEQALKKL
jgi:hypothetical protein